MRGSYGGTYVKGSTAADGGGGGGSGGGGIVSTVAERAVRLNGAQESLPSSSKIKTSSKHVNVLSINNIWPPISNTDFGEWEVLEDDYGNDIFRVLPSSHEVQNAIFSLQQVIHPVSPSRLTNLDQMHFDIDNDASSVIEKASSTSSDSDWMEPSTLMYNQRFPVSSRFDSVYDVLTLLQTEPSVQKIVVSLSTDKAVWDAVLNNKAVREIREAYRNGQPNPQNSDENSDTNPNVLKWMFINMKSKLLEAMAALSHFLDEILKKGKAEESDAFLSENLKSTFLLTIVVFLIVVIARGYNT